MGDCAWQASADDLMTSNQTAKAAAPGPRVLHLTPGCFDKGGISRYSRYQITALRQICGSPNVRVLSLLGPDADGFENMFEVDWCGTSRSGAVTGRDRAQFAARAVGIAAGWRPNVVISAHVNFGPLLSVVARVAGAKSVLNVYGLEIWSGLSASRRAHMKRTNRIMADCHFTAQYVVEEGLHAAPPTVIWDPVDLERFRPASIERAVLERYGIPDPAAHFIVMSLGRLAKAATHKGFDRLIEAAAVAAGQLPRLRLVIAGRGDDRRRLEELATARGIADKVVFTGPVDETDLPGIYRAAHVFSLVSDRGHGRGEGIPLTPLEAMACGAPVIVGNEDGSQEAVDGGRNGFVISPRDPDALVRALVALGSSEVRRAAMAQEARSVAVERFGFESFSAKHAALLADMMAGGTFGYDSGELGAGHTS